MKSRVSKLAYFRKRHRILQKTSPSYRKRKVIAATKWRKENRDEYNAYRRKYYHTVLKYSPKYKARVRNRFKSKI